MKRPAYEWVPDTTTAASTFAGGCDWNLQCALSGVVVGWAYKSVFCDWRAGCEYKFRDFDTLADAARWVEKQAGAR